MIDQKLLEILICPETHQRLELVDRDKLDAINSRVAQGSLHYKDGTPVASSLEAALIREDQKVAYEIRANIPIMLVDKSLALA